MYGVTDSEFTEKYATGNLYKKIVSELTMREEGDITGNMLVITPKMLSDFLFYVLMGADLEDAAKSTP